MIRLLFLALIFCVSGAASAQPAPAVQPASIGTPHECRGYYPPDLNATVHSAIIQVGFTITPQGTVTDPRITRSSGIPQLDEAVIACVRHWQYRPATADGVPVAVPWKAFVQWLDDMANPSPRELATRALRLDVWQCLHASAEAVAMPAETSAALRVHIKYSTWLSKAQFDITGSSGNDALDKAALACAARSTYLADAESKAEGSPGVTLLLAVWK